MVEATLSSTYTSPRVDDPALQEPPTKKQKRVHMFHDAITVSIPLEVTADLGVAIRRTRIKRIEALHQAFPSLNKKKKKNDPDDEDDDDSSKVEEGAEKKQEDADNNNPNNVPQPQEFASVLDYLEAKYVRGVMIHADQKPNKKKRKSTEDGDDDDEASDTAAGKQRDDDDDDEGEGSVYSQSSFLDDRDLQRDVAEQVLAQTTTTKMELEGDNDDFFVNVGDLEVEETELTQQHYDPLQDSPTKKKPSVTKKRKKKDANETTVTKNKTKDGKLGSPAKKKAAAAKKKGTKSPKADKDNKKSQKKTPTKKKKATKEKASEEKKKKKTPVKKKKKEGSDKGSDSSDDSSDDEPLAEAVPNKPPKNKPKLSPEKMKKLRLAAAKYKKVWEKVYQKIKTMIKEMPADQLPRRRKQKSKVSITCPKNKKAGDMVTFDNPHIPGQRLRVGVPEGTGPGETFQVTVPVPKEAEPDDDTDHNKFDRDFQEILDEYARAYDEWCQHEGEYRHALAGGDNSVFQVHLEKRNKFDKMVKEFPKNLMTPVDVEYIKKVVRRARQNKHKRLKTMAARRASNDGPKDENKKDATDDEEEEEEEAESEEEEEEKEPEPEYRTLVVPQLGRVFPAIKHNELHFFVDGPP